MKLKHVASLVLLLLPLGLVPSSAVEAGSAPASARAANEDYRIAPRDYIQFQIHSQPDTTTHQRVTANGELQLPLLGTIKLAGLTVREAEIMLKERYREGGFFVSPQVILSVEQYRERYISLLGQVKNPDRVALPMEANSMGVLHAIARVGGFTRIARTDAVQILRTAPDGMEARITLNLDEFLKPKPAAPASAEFQLEPGDVVFVPERAF
jgi:polysaccharide biosynthesis/export protein